MAKLKQISIVQETKLDVPIFEKVSTMLKKYNCPIGVGEEFIDNCKVYISEDLTIESKVAWMKNNLPKMSSSKKREFIRGAREFYMATENFFNDLCAKDLEEYSFVIQEIDNKALQIIDHLRFESKNEKDYLIHIGMDVAQCSMRAIGIEMNDEKMEKVINECESKVDMVYSGHIANVIGLSMDMMLADDITDEQLFNYFVAVMWVVFYTKVFLEKGEVIPWEKYDLTDEDFVTH